MPGNGCVESGACRKTGIGREQFIFLLSVRDGGCRTCYGRGSDKGKYRSRLLFGSPDKICASEKPAYRTDERSCGELPEMDLWMGEIKREGKNYVTI